MKVGFIGLGAMGRPMALHLHKAGHDLHAWARRPESAAGLLATLVLAVGSGWSIITREVTGQVDTDEVT